MGTAQQNQRFTRRAIVKAAPLSMFLPPLVFAAKAANTPPDFPKFVIKAQVRTGNPIVPVEAHSDANGYAQIDLGAGWFHKLSIKILEGALPYDKLDFKYNCCFLANGTRQVSPTYEDGIEVPPGAMPDQIRAFRFKLGGSFADDYTLTYGGRVAYKGANNPQKSFSGLTPNSWLGSPPEGGASDEWVSQITISLHRS